MFVRGVHSALSCSLFISDLEDSLKTKSSGRIKIGDQEVSIIMFADDLVLLADSSEGLQQSPSVLQEYCRVWQLTISTEKTKVMINSKASLSTRYRFFINDKEIETISSIKYLGLVLKSNGSLLQAVSTLTHQARKSVFVLMKKITFLDFPPPFLMCKLFDTLITPIIEYGCQIWNFQAGNNREIEILHRKFCKFILKVPSSATNVGVYGATKKGFIVSQILDTSEKFLQYITHFMGMFLHTSEVQLSLVKTYTRHS